MSGLMRFRARRNIVRSCLQFVEEIREHCIQLVGCILKILIRRLRRGACRLRGVSVVADK